MVPADVLSPDPVSHHIASSKAAASEDVAITFAMAALEAAGGSGKDERSAVQRARALLNLSEREADWRHYDLAYKHALDCLHASSTLDKRKGRALRATALTNLSVRLAELGRYSEALSTVTEAVGIWQALSAKRGDYSPQWAKAVAVLALRLSDTGQPEEAVQHAERAVALCRAGTGFDSGERIEELAVCLNALALLYAQVGRRADALDPAVETVSLRHLAMQHSGARVTPTIRYGRALSNLSALYSELGRADDSVRVARQAVNALSSIDDRAAGPTLAAAQNNLAVALAATGQNDEAARAASQAVATLREMLQSAPGSFDSDLASGLNTLAIRLAKAGNPEGALAAAEEAVLIRRDLASVYPAANAAALASELHTLARRLRDVGRVSDALQTLDESILLWRQLAAVMPAGYETRLLTARATRRELSGQATHPPDGSNPENDDDLAAGGFRPEDHLLSGLADRLRELQRRRFGSK